MRTGVKKEIKWYESGNRKSLRTLHYLLRPHSFQRRLIAISFLHWDRKRELYAIHTIFTYYNTYKCEMLNCLNMYMYILYVLAKNVLVSYNIFFRKSNRNSWTWTWEKEKKKKSLEHTKISYLWNQKVFPHLTYQY